MFGRIFVENAQEMSFISLTISLFLIFNAVGSIPIFVTILSPYDAHRQRIIILRELIVALCVILLFNFLGAEILRALGISHSIIGVTGGLLLILIGLNLIFPKDFSKSGYPKHEPMIIPLAIPSLAGPGTITAVMLFSSQKGMVISAIAFVIAWIPSLLILLASSFIKRYLGEKGLQAVQRLGGMIICLIGIQMLLIGIVGVVKENFSY
jgi:multiple antibiotic resistance protein